MVSEHGKRSKRVMTREHEPKSGERKRGAEERGGGTENQIRAFARKAKADTA